MTDSSPAAVNYPPSLAGLFNGVAEWKTALEYCTKLGSDSSAESGKNSVDSGGRLIVFVFACSQERMRWRDGRSDFADFWEFYGHQCTSTYHKGRTGDDDGKDLHRG